VYLDIEDLDLVGTLGGGHDVHEVGQVDLLDVLLAEVLEVSLGEGHLGGHDQLGLLAGDGHLGTEVTSLTVDLDSVVKELLEVLEHEDTLVHGLGTLDDELGGGDLLDRLSLSLWM